MSASERLERLEREGAEGKWAIYEETHHEPGDDPKRTDRWITDNGTILNWGDGEIPLGPAQLIVTLRNALPELIAVVKAAEQFVGSNPQRWPEINIGEALAALDRKLSEGDESWRSGLSEQRQ